VIVDWLSICRMFLLVVSSTMQLFLDKYQGHISWNQMDAWTHKGGAIFASEKTLSLHNRKSQGAAVIVKFSSPPDEAIRTSLKSLGLKWNALRQEWEGYAVVKEVRQLLSEHEADIIEMG